MFVYGASSCIRYDRSNCAAALSVSFTYVDYTRGKIAIRDGDIKNAVLYIYDDDDRFVRTWTIDAPVFNKEYMTDFTLDRGTYSFVVWFNPGEPYTVSGECDNHDGKAGRRMESCLRLSLPDDKCIRGDLPLLFHGTLCDTYLEGSTKERIAIPMILNNNVINLTVKGLPYSDNTYLFSVSDSNGHYTFENGFSDCEEFDYAATINFRPYYGTNEQATNTLNASLMVLKLAAGRKPVIELSDQTLGKVLYPSYEGQTTDLVRLILKADPSNDFDGNDTYDILFDFATDMTATIYVNGWRVKESENEIYPD